MNPNLEIFLPYTGKTWKALLNPDQGLYDTARWEIALKGNVLRILHALSGSVYGGETLLFWDEEAQTLVYTYCTTARFYTHGTAEPMPGGKIFFKEQVVGPAGGVTANEVVLSLDAPNQMHKQVRSLRNGEWSEWRDVIYSEAPGEFVPLD